MRYGFGVDLGGTFVKLASFTEDGALLDKWQIPTVTENVGKQILPDIAASMDAYIREKGWKHEDIVGVGMGVPGAVDKDGIVDQCDNLGWPTQNVRETFSRMTGLPVLVCNDANAAALGESWKGGGSGFESMVLVTLGTGVGGGIILDGKPLLGVNGSAGEIGHMVIRKDESICCSCGKRGCAEQYCSATGIVRLAKSRLQSTSQESVLRGKTDFTCKDVFDAAGEGDDVAAQTLEEVYDCLGQLLANICCVVNPQAIVLGGGVSKAGMPLLEGAKRHFDRYAYHAAGAEFALAQLGNDAGVYGAFKLVMDNR